MSEFAGYENQDLNPLHYRVKKGGQHDVGVELEAIIPKAGEIRLLGNRNDQCTYYQVGKSPLANNTNLLIYTKLALRA